jgi:uncharacterized delta-60 repeat protein
VRTAPMRAIVPRRRWWIPPLVQLVLLVSTAIPASGSAGDLDPSFSGDGIVQRRLGRMPTSIAALVRASHGDIVAAANVGCCGGQDVAIAGFDSAGALDPSFGDGGMRLIDTEETDRVIWIGRDHADRIVVVGYRQLFGSACRFEVCINLLLARFLADGSPDPSYGDGGVITIDSPQDRYPLDAAIDKDGRLVLVGRMEQRDETDRTVVARFLDDGSPDPEFGAGGSVTFSEPKQAVGVALDGRGRVVVAGAIARSGEPPAPLVARLLPSGDRDTTFSGNGVLSIHAWPGAAEGDGGAFHALAIDADGRILAAGHHAIDGEARIAIARIASAGHLHRGFSNDGALELDSPRTSSAIEWIGADDRGRVVFAGTAQGITLWDVVVGRVTSEGTPDPSFGGDGVIRTDVDAYQDFATRSSTGGADSWLGEAPTTGPMATSGFCSAT